MKRERNDLSELLEDEVAVADRAVSFSFQFLRWRGMRATEVSGTRRSVSGGVWSESRAHPRRIGSHHFLSVAKEFPM